MSTAWLGVARWPLDRQRVVGQHGPRVDAETKAKMGLFRGHVGMISSVAWSHDGTRIVSESDDDTVRVWGVAERIVCVYEQTCDLAALCQDPIRAPGWQVPRVGRLRSSQRKAIETSDRRALRVIFGHDICWEIGPPVAWVPARLDELATHPSGRLWAGVVDMSLYLICLEGDSKPFR